MKTGHLYQGVDPEVVQAAIRKGRRERAEALAAMLRKVFSRPVAVEADEEAREGLPATLEAKLAA